MTNYINERNIKDIERTYDFAKGTARLKYLSKEKNKNVASPVLAISLSVIFVSIIFAIGVFINQACILVAIAVGWILFKTFRLSKKQERDIENSDVYLGIVAGFRDDREHRYALIMYKDGIDWNWQSDVDIDKRFICGDLVRFIMKDNSVKIIYNEFEKDYDTFDQSIYSTASAPSVEHSTNKELFDGYGFRVDEEHFSEIMNSFNFGESSKIKFGNAVQGRAIMYAITAVACMPFLFVSIGIISSGIKAHDIGAIVMGACFGMGIIFAVGLVVILGRASKAKQEQYKEMKRYIGVCHDTWFIRWTTHGTNGRRSTHTRTFMRLRYKNGDNWYEQTVEPITSVYSKGSIVEFVLDENTKTIEVVDTDLSEYYTSFDQVLE